MIALRIFQRVICTPKSRMIRHLVENHLLKNYCYCLEVFFLILNDNFWMYTIFRHTHISYSWSCLPWFPNHVLIIQVSCIIYPHDIPVVVRQFPPTNHGPGQPSESSQPSALSSMISKTSMARRRTAWAAQRPGTQSHLESNNCGFL